MIKLDPRFFDSNNTLKGDVRRVLLRVVGDVRSDLDEDGVRLEPEYVVITGSLVGPDWDRFSDVDLHIGYDPADFDDPGMVKKYLGLYSKDFNSRNYDLLDRHIEIYFQDIVEPHVSPGLYDVENNIWLRMPEGDREGLDDNVRVAADRILKAVGGLEDEYRRGSRDYTAGEVEDFQRKLDRLWDRIKEMRRGSLAAHGLFGYGNLVFKRLRRNRALEMLGELRRRVQDDVYEVYRNGHT